MNLIRRAAMEMQTEKRFTDRGGGGEGEGEMNGEELGGAHTNICKQPANGNLPYDSGNSKW